MPFYLHHKRLPKLLGLQRQDNGQFDMTNLRQLLESHGIDERGRSLYLNFGDDLFEPFEDKSLGYLGLKPVDAKQAIAWLRLLQQTGIDVPPPYELVVSIPRWNAPSLDAIPPLFLRAAWQTYIATTYQRAYSSEFDMLAAISFFDNTIIPVAQWFFDSETYLTIHPDQLKGGWQEIMRLRSESLEQQGLGEWKVPIRSMDYEDVRFVALSTEKALKSEGSIIGNNVCNYVEICRAGAMLIYSVRNRADNRTIAIITLINNLVSEAHTLLDMWVIYKIIGPGDIEITDQRLISFADALRDVIDLEVARQDWMGIREPETKPEIH